MWGVGALFIYGKRDKDVHPYHFFVVVRKNEINIHTICWVLRNWNESTSIPSFGSLMPYKELA
jgi:hypothetical protein